MVQSRPRPHIGDVVEIASSGGRARAQYTHKHPTFGAVLRVFAPGWPESISPDRLADWPVQFTTLFPLSQACARGIARILGTAPLPAAARAFPIFRAAIPQALANGPKTWWLWDGDREWRVGALAPEQRALPLREIVNDTLLVERANSGWQPEQVQ
jgi:hypothetical protein